MQRTDASTSPNSQQPPVCKQWADDDKRELLEASKVEIALGDTALGWVQQRKQQEVQQSINIMTNNELAIALVAREDAKIICRIVLLAEQ